MFLKKKLFFKEIFQSLEIKHKKQKISSSARRAKDKLKIKKGSLPSKKEDLAGIGVYLTALLEN